MKVLLTRIWLIFVAVYPILQPAFRLLIFSYGYMMRNAILRFSLK